MLNNKKYSLDRHFPGIYSTFFCLSICFFLFLSLAGLDPHEQILIINNKYRLFRFLSSSVCCPPTPPLPPPVEKGQSCQRSLEQSFFPFSSSQPAETDRTHMNSMTLSVCSIWDDKSLYFYQNSDLTNKKPILLSKKFPVR